MEGFGEVIPIEWLQYFDEAELEMILCGVQNIDIADWEKNTVLKNYQKNSKQVNSNFYRTELKKVAKNVIVVPLGLVVINDFTIIFNKSAL